MDKNMTLEKRIDAELYSYQGRMSVFVDDLQGHTVERGADEEFETASVIKAFLLAALYLQAERGKADLSAEIEYEASQFVDGSGMLRALGVGARLKVKDTATMMIICSDNIATNMLIDYLGLDTINACIRELGFAHTVLHNALHFDRYRQLGTTTPRDYASLLAQMARGTLVSKAASVEMLAIGAGFKGRKALGYLRPTAVATAVKLMALPALFLPVAVHLGFTDEKLVALLVMLGSIATPSCYVMAKQMGHEGVLTGSVCVTTTLFSAFSLTFWLFLLRSMGCIA